MEEAHRRQAIYDLYARCARDEEAAVQRQLRGGKVDLVDQMRRTIGL